MSTLETRLLRWFSSSASCHDQHPDICTPQPHQHHSQNTQWLQSSPLLPSVSHHPVGLVHIQPQVFSSSPLRKIGWYIKSTVTFALFDCSLCRYIKKCLSVPPHTASIGNTLTGKLPTCSLSSLTIDSISSAPAVFPSTVSV